MDGLFLTMGFFFKRFFSEVGREISDDVEPESIGFGVQLKMNP